MKFKVGVVPADRLGCLLLLNNIFVMNEGGRCQLGFSGQFDRPARPSFKLSDFYAQTFTHFGEEVFSS
jgi:hypothetical protein